MAKIKDFTTAANEEPRYLNRELSWLEFNARVLAEASNPNTPLLERMRFLSISASNLDEFFMVRVAGLKAQAKEGSSKTSMDGLSVQEQLSLIQDKAYTMMQEEQSRWVSLRDELEDNGIKILNYEDIGKQDRAYLDQYFESDIFPLLTPLAVDPAHPFPFIPNKEMAIAVHMRGKEGKKLEAILPLPLNLPRFIALPGKEDHYCLLEDLMLHHLSSLFPPFTLEDSVLFRVIRDTEMDIDDDAEDLVKTFESALKRRRRGRVIQLLLNKDTTPEMESFLVDNLEVRAEDIHEINGIIGLSDAAELCNIDRPALKYTPFDIRFPERIRDFGGDCFAAIKHKDILVHHPYESFDVVVQFIKQAARDPHVLSIKQTLYRTSKDSPIVQALIEAAEAGKAVTALVELKARFDEEANIRWARDLERAGAQVVFGFAEYKTHAKLSLVARQEGKVLQQYAHFGTGNYHPANAKVYTDLSYFTCDKALCGDMVRIFNFLTGYATPQDLQKVRIAPLALRQTLYDQLDNEIALAEAGKPASFWGKMNALVDKDMIEKLYEASQAGVQIDLVIRGICALRPGVKGLSENIRVRSLIGRFLEHARIYAFGNGEPMPSSKAKVFMASADMMTRNLDWRVEALVPIENETVHEQVLEQILFANMLDNQNSWEMHKDGSYSRITGDKPFSAHEYFMNNPSLSGRGTALTDEAEDELQFKLLQTKQQPS